MITLFYEGYNNKTEREIIEPVAMFASKKLFPRFKVTITFSFVKNLIDKEQIEGEVIGDSNPREFTVRIHKGLKKEDLTTLIIHEFVHIKQYVKKELYYKYDKRNCKYKMYFKSRFVENLEYLNQPHEKEAFRLQESLYKEYINYINI